jgi:signal transduction histidine kinase
MTLSLPNRFAPSGFVIAGIGFFLTRFTVTLAAYEDPVRFVIAGVVPLVLGLGLAASGVALAVGGFERSFVNTVTVWCIAGAASMLLLIFLTLVGNGTSIAMEPVRSQTYLSNFLIGGSVGGALTGIYAGRASHQRRTLKKQASQLEMVNRLLRDEVLNAITVIQGRAEVLHTVDDSSSVTAIERRSGDVRSTIENVKHITRNATTALESTPVAPCVDSAVAEVTGRYPDGEITATDIDSSLAVWANPLLEDALSHLIENGIAYSDGSPPTAEIDVSATEKAVSITVTDNGPGLPAQQQQLIEDGEIGEYEDRSIGFGLNIVRLLAESYNGSVTATVTDSGTSITLTLRRADTGLAATSGSETRLSRMQLGLVTTASLIAGAVMGAFLQMIVGSVPVVGSLYGSTNVWIGWITHEFHSVVFGFIYVSLTTLIPDTYSDRIRYYGVGIAWGAVLWLVAASIIMPLWLRLVGFSVAVPNLQAASLVGHLLWGLILGIAYQIGWTYVENS